MNAPARVPSGQAAGNAPQGCGIEPATNVTGAGCRLISRNVHVGYAMRSSRSLRGCYFAPEAHTEYTALGFAGSPPVSPDGIARPEMKSYFTQSIRLHGPGTR